MTVNELRKELELIDGESEVTIIFNHEPFSIEKVELDPYYQGHEFSDIPLCIKVEE